MKPEKRVCPACGKVKPTTAYAIGAPACRVCVALPAVRVGATRKTVERNLRTAYQRLHVKDRLGVKRGAA